MHGLEKMDFATNNARQIVSKHDESGLDDCVVYERIVEDDAILKTVYTGKQYTQYVCKNNHLSI